MTNTVSSTNCKGYYVLAAPYLFGDMGICYSSFRHLTYADAVADREFYSDDWYVVFVAASEEESVNYQGEGENDFLNPDKHADMVPNWYVNYEKMMLDWYYDAVRNPEFDSSLVEQVHCSACGDVLTENENVVCDECDYALYYTGKYRTGRMI